jgi:hypothetical protein
MSQISNAAVAALLALFIVAIGIVPQARARGSGICRLCYSVCDEHLGRGDVDVLACRSRCNRESCVRATGHPKSQRKPGSRLPKGEIPY